jgi:hypothetical protein
MPVTDPISDFLTRIRNAAKAKKPRVDIPSSFMKKNLAEILKKQNFIDDFSVIEDNKQNIIRVQLKYRNGLSAISGLRRISTPGLGFTKILLIFLEYSTVWVLLLYQPQKDFSPIKKLEKVLSAVKLFVISGNLLNGVL